MRALLALPLLLAVPAAAADLRSMAECVAAIGADPAAAREAAARWVVLGGGAEARVCEARTLEALGAKGTAATILSEVASDRSTGLPAATRAALLREAGRLWLAEGEPVVALEALGRVLQIEPKDADTLVMRAEAQGRLGRWAEARADLALALALAPGRPDILTLSAAARRKAGDPAGGLADADAALAGLPHYPEALFEKGASLATMGRMREALDVWFKLIELHPDSEMADLARRNVRRLAGE